MTVQNVLRPLLARRRSNPRRLRALLRGDGGMSTVEYALGTLTAAAVAGILYAAVQSDVIKNAVTALLERGFSGTF
ncbi:DUF4244 domain-containing protein [Saccharopolyspora taberi]|uniref:DUF4244 domain-containing protein n=1 Tax=Saccharopolyspora taberi TaxID=60895 RepID=A0ABN3VD70_9PSEU